MTDITKATLYAVAQPTAASQAISKAVLYVAFTASPVTPVRKRVNGRIRYGQT